MAARASKIGGWWGEGVGLEIRASRLLGDPSSTLVDAATVLKRWLEEVIDGTTNPRHDALIHRGDKFFHFRNSGLQVQSVLYVRIKLASIMLCYCISLTPVLLSRS